MRYCVKVLWAHLTSTCLRLSIYDINVLLYIKHAQCFQQWMDRKQTFKYLIFRLSATCTVGPALFFLTHYCVCSWKRRPKIPVSSGQQVAPTVLAKPHARPPQYLHVFWSAATPPLQPPALCWMVRWMSPISPQEVLIFTKNWLLP